jgi:hypothetical protein
MSSGLPGRRVPGPAWQSLGVARASGVNFSDFKFILVVLVLDYYYRD